MAMEERAFTKAELKLFTKKYEEFLQAQRVVDEFVIFLREQHEIEQGDQDWQIGQNGFFRLEKEVPPFDALPQGDKQSDADTKRQTSKPADVPPATTGGETEKKKPN